MDNEVPCFVNFSLWKQKEYWSVNEALYLAFGLHPIAAEKFFILDQKIRERCIAALDPENTDQIKPDDFIKWAVKQNFPVPEEPFSNPPSTETEWFKAIQKIMYHWKNQHRKFPSRKVVWDILSKYCEEDFGIVACEVEKEVKKPDGTPYIRKEAAVCMEGERPLLKKHFKDNWNAWTKKS